LTTSEDEETITINRPGRSTYPEEKSVLTSGATPGAIVAMVAGMWVFGGIKLHDLRFLQTLIVGKAPTKAA